MIILGQPLFGNKNSGDNTWASVRQEPLQLMRKAIRNGKLGVGKTKDKLKNTVKDTLTSIQQEYRDLGQ